MTNESNPTKTNEINPVKMNLAMAHLYCWQYAKATNFTAKLYELFCKADEENKIRLGLAFPYEYRAFHLWHTSENPHELFREWGFIE